MQIDLQEKYLPIGTVVLLKNAKKKLMITGFYVLSTSGEQKIFDYSGCIFPEGFISSDKICFFNHNQVEKIFHVGMVDDDVVNFKKKLIENSDEIVKRMFELAKENNSIINEKKQDNTVFSFGDMN